MVLASQAERGRRVALDAIRQGRGGVCRLDSIVETGVRNDEGDRLLAHEYTVALDDERCYRFIHQRVTRDPSLGVPRPVVQVHPDSAAVEPCPAGVVPTVVQLSRLPAPGWAPMWPAVADRSVDDPYAVAGPPERTRGKHPWEPALARRPWRRSLPAAGAGVVVGALLTTLALWMVPKAGGADAQGQPGARVDASSSQPTDPAATTPSPSPEQPEAGTAAAPTPSEARSTVGPIDTFSEAGLTQVLQEFERMSGNDELARLAVHEHLVKADMPIEPDSDKFDEFEYHEHGGFARTGPTLIQPRADHDGRFRLGDVQPEVLADVIRRAPGDGGYEGRPPSHLIVQHMRRVDDAPVIRVYVGDDYGDAMVTYSLDGELIDVYR